MKNHYKSIIANCKICKTDGVVYAKFEDSSWALFYDSAIDGSYISDILTVFDTNGVRPNTVPNKLHRTDDENSNIACPMLTGFLLSTSTRIVKVGIESDIPEYAQSISTNKSIIIIPTPNKGNIEFIKASIDKFIRKAKIT